MTYLSESEEEDDCFIDWTYELINDKYIMIKKLGKGSYCAVWLVYNYIENVFNALKVYNRCDYKRGKKEIKIFDELRTKKINNVITYNHCFEYRNEDYNDCDSDNISESSHYNGNKFLCVEMELGGYSIYDVIKKFKHFEKKPPIEYFYMVTKNTIDVLNNIHKNGYVHSDVKPENILLKKPTYETHLLMKAFIKCKGTKFAKINKKNVNEFIKRLKSEDKLFNVLENINTEDIYTYLFDKTNTFDIILCDMGTTIKPNSPNLYKKYTIYYRAPETILKLSYDHTYDYWSLGCTIYEMITNEILFEADNDLELLYEIISKLGPLSKEIIKDSPYKDKFFTSSGNRLRGYKKITFNPISTLLEEVEVLSDTDKFSRLILLITNLLNYNKSERKMNL